MGSVTTRKLIECQDLIGAKMAEFKRLASRQINSLGAVHNERQLRDADFDSLLDDVARICQIRVEVDALVKDRTELGNA